MNHTQGKIKILNLNQTNIGQYINKLSEMEHEAWHEYYSQYHFYEYIKDTASIEMIKQNWLDFVSGNIAENAMITGQEKRCYIALDANENIIGEAALTSYKENVWNEADDYFRKNNAGKLPKILKLQNLYISPNYRGLGLGHYLALVRLDYAIANGYQAVFMTTYKDATKTNEYHLKNKMQHLYDYESLQSFKDGKRLAISCFVNPDIQSYRSNIYSYIADGTSSSNKIKAADICYS